MKKTTYLLLATTVFVVLFASACSGSAAPTVQATQAPAEAVATQAPAQASVPTQPPAATAQTFAPACQAATSCAAPDVKDIPADATYCVEKIPYQNIIVDPGTTFEPVDPKGDLKCKDSGTVVNGKNVVTCSGTQLTTYELKVTNSACSASALATGTGQCQDGLGYDAAQNCCAPLSTSDANSVTIKVNIGACPLSK